MPVALDELVATALRDVLPHAMGNGHPAFFGWVNPPPSPAGVIASLAAAAMNPSVVAGDHADVHLERTVVRWLAELVGFPHAPGAGLLTSGGSAATIVCLAGARSRALAAAGHDVRRDGLAGAPRLIAYVPAEAHSCVQRALELLGLGSGADARGAAAGGRLDALALRAAIAADRAGGAASGAARRLGRDRQLRRDRPARRARRRRDRGGPLVPRRRRLRRVRRARPGDRGPLSRHGAGRLAGRSTRTSGWASPSTPAARSCGAATTCATRSASSRPTCARTPTRRWGRSPSTGPSRRGRSAPSRRGRPSPRADAPASPRRWRARTRSPASSRRWSSASPSWSWPPRPRPPSSPSARARRGCPPGAAGRAQPRAAGGGPGARPRLRHRHRLRRPRDAARLHPASGHELRAPRDARRRSRRDGPHPGRLRIGRDRGARRWSLPRRREMGDFMSRSSDRLRSPGEGPRQARPTTPGDHHAEVPAPQALPRRPGAAPSRAPDGPVGARGRGGAHGLPQARQRAARGERRVRRRAGAHAGAAPGCATAARTPRRSPPTARCPRPATSSRAGT